MPTWRAGLVALLAASCTPLPPPADPLDTPAAAPAKPMPCRRQFETRPAAAAPVSLEALRGVLDRALDEPAIQSVLTQLGPARIEREEAATERLRRRYERYGIVLAIDDRAAPPRIRRVELTTRSLLPAYNGPLPEQLSFELDVRRTFAALGLPDEGRLLTYAWMPHHYGTRGFAVEFDDSGCLSAVTLQAPRAPDSVRFTQLEAKVQDRRRGLSGFSVRAVRELGALPQSVDDLRLGVELFDANGSAIHLLETSGVPSAATRIEILDSLQGTADRSLFVAFAALALAPGQQRVHAKLRARRGEHELAVSGESELELSLDMPQLVRAQVGVKSVEVEVGAYDSVAYHSGLGARTLAHFQRPDLRWRLEHDVPLAHGFGTVTHLSKVRDDTFRAAWTELTPAFVSAPQDSFMLCVEDDDVGFASEELGCFDATVERTKQLAAADTAVADRKVRALRFAKPRVTPLLLPPR